MRLPCGEPESRVSAGAADRLHEPSRSRPLLSRAGRKSGCSVAGVSTPNWAACFVTAPYSETAPYCWSFGPRSRSSASGAFLVGAVASAVALGTATELAFASVPALGGWGPARPGGPEDLDAAGGVGGGAAAGLGPAPGAPPGAVGGAAATWIAPDAAWACSMAWRCCAIARAAASRVTRTALTSLAIAAGLCARGVWVAGSADGGAARN